jgi:hypothetical protein
LVGKTGIGFVVKSCGHLFLSFYLMFRIAAITILTAIILLFIFGIITAIYEGESGIFFLVLLYGTASIFFPALLAAFIFYLLVKKIDKDKATIPTQIRVGFLFMVICILGLLLWGYGEWLLSGDTTWDEFIDRYSQFVGGNIVIVPGCIIITRLHFSRFMDGKQVKTKTKR